MVINYMDKQRKRLLQNTVDVYCLELSEEKWDKDPTLFHFIILSFVALNSDYLSLLLRYVKGSNPWFGVSQGSFAHVHWLRSAATVTIPNIES